MLGLSLSGRALQQGIWSYDLVNPRDFATDNHRVVDDTPFGGGAGMVLKPDILESAVRSIPDYQTARRIYLSPRGRVLTQALAQELITESHLILLCGRYEGVDQRFLDVYDFEEISIGDYVLSGGEPAAMILMDACIRLLPNVMGNAETAGEESFSNGLLEYPHYTRPAHWVDADGNTHSIPEILSSGHHANIQKWRYEESLKLTQERRPDLLKAHKQ
jgi:tRNA (guanine37-N1)-methyltransferase